MRETYTNNNMRDFVLSTTNGMDHVSFISSDYFMKSVNRFGKIDDDDNHNVNLL